ncbi:hypothetical protein LX36DRAFT_449351 [Colletotrichum falcatum]|nr:hypothetical protein LX36DRAFT_449351 [Colletotrichum falcatum]
MKRAKEGGMSRGFPSVQFQSSPVPKHRTRIHTFLTFLLRIPPPSVSLAHSHPWPLRVFSPVAVGHCLVQLPSCDKGPAAVTSFVTPCHGSRHSSSQPPNKSNSMKDTRSCSFSPQTFNHCIWTRRHFSFPLNSACCLLESGKTRCLSLYTIPKDPKPNRLTPLDADYQYSHGSLK